MPATAERPTPAGPETGEPADLPACATFYAITGFSDYSWRVLAPARAVGAKTCLIPEVGGFYAITQPNDDSAFRWNFDPSRDDGFIDYPDHEGPVAVWTRPDLARATHAKAMRDQLGIRTLAETDDNYVGNPRLNVFMRSNKFDAKARLEHLKASASMDGIIFSTRWLRDSYHRAIRKEFGRTATPEMFVCRNHVAESDWPERVERDGPLRVGWMGSPSHVWDVDIAWPALMYAKQRGCETWMIGYDPANPEFEVTSEKAKAKVAAWRKVGYREVGWQDLGGERQRLPLDIGLCPLLTNEFTLGKSDVKAIEYAISGAAVVASNNPVYSREWIHGETALLAGSAAEMLEMTRVLIEDAGLRGRLVANAQQYVREERGLKQMTEEWTEAIG